MSSSFEELYSWLDQLIDNPGDPEFQKLKEDYLERNNETINDIQNNNFHSKIVTLMHIVKFTPQELEEVKNKRLLEAQDKLERVLKRKLTVEDLKQKGIIRTEAEAKARKLEKNIKATELEKKLQQRPTRDELEEKKILMKDDEMFEQNESDNMSDIDSDVEPLSDIDSNDDLKEVEDIPQIYDEGRITGDSLEYLQHSVEFQIDEDTTRPNIDSVGVDDSLTSDDDGSPENGDVLNISYTMHDVTDGNIDEYEYFDMAKEFGQTELLEEFKIADNIDSTEKSNFVVEAESQISSLKIENPKQIRLDAKKYELDMIDESGTGKLIFQNDYSGDLIIRVGNLDEILLKCQETNTFEICSDTIHEIRIFNEENREIYLESIFDQEKGGNFVQIEHDEEILLILDSSHIK
eukprot:TRINITY_DN1214_c0_g1_i3.p1 TRINITY_DN1214_c0_g1~~TRINITY_DN1214_c0_g1_i3.p1  ORF type:complete len:407 (+),score=152.51 TRINITY_DN1214_c0_g1_i3:37-1257(+)